MISLYLLTIIKMAYLDRHSYAEYVATKLISFLPTTKYTHARHENQKSKKHRRVPENYD